MAIASGIGSIVSQGEGATPSPATPAARRRLQQQLSPAHGEHNLTNGTAALPASSGGAALTTAESASEGKRHPNPDPKP